MKVITNRFLNYLLKIKLVLNHVTHYQISRSLIQLINVQPSIESQPIFAKESSQAFVSRYEWQIRPFLAIY